MLLSGNLLTPDLVGVAKGVPGAGAPFFDWIFYMPRVDESKRL